MNIEKSLDIIKGKLLMIDKMLKQDQEEGHGSSYEMQKEDFEAIETILTAYEKEKEKNKELNKLKGFEMLDIFNMGKQSSRQRIEFDYVDKEKIKAGIEVAREKYNDLHTKHLRDCGIAEQRELAKIEFGESLLKEE